MKINQYFNTNGKGLWSSKIAKVKCTKIDVGYYDKENLIGQINVYFDTSTWDVETDGVIYTDKNWLKEFKEFLRSKNISDEVDYSEYGMQGENYVSLDADSPVIKHFLKLSKN